MPGTTASSGEALATLLTKVLKVSATRPEAAIGPLVLVLVDLMGSTRADCPYVSRAPPSAVEIEARGSLLGAAREIG